MRDNKASVRDKLLALRNAMTPEEVNAGSEKIFKKLKAQEKFRRAKGVLVYSSFRNEVKTDRIIALMEDLGKVIYLPVVMGDGCLVACKNSDITQRNTYGISEPVPVETDLLDNEKIDLAVCPGVGFDRSLNRIGFGKGYYDRFLSKAAVYKIGLCYDFQMVDSVYPDPHDVPMDMVISEKRIYKRRK